MALEVLAKSDDNPELRRGRRETRHQTKPEAVVPKTPEPELCPDVEHTNLTVSKQVAQVPAPEFPCPSIHVKVFFESEVLAIDDTGCMDDGNGNVVQSAYPSFLE